MDGTHGFGFGVTGAELRARIVARAACPECVGTRRVWSLHTRAAVACPACAGGTLAPAALRTYAPVLPLRPRVATPQAA